jgi:hypothetical protein
VVVLVVAWQKLSHIPTGASVEKQEKPADKLAENVSVIILFEIC